MQKKTNHLLIDVNGKAYICNDNETFNTDIQLNFNNKTKEAKQIYPLPDPRVIRVKEKSFH